jgi:hypothetical protein
MLGSSEPAGSLGGIYRFYLQDRKVNQTRNQQKSGKLKDLFGLLLDSEDRSDIFFRNFRVLLEPHGVEEERPLRREKLKSNKLLVIFSLLKSTRRNV